MITDQKYTADILVVDDTPDNLRLLVGMLSDSSYQVRPVASGEAALKTMRVRRPDLVLLDINMPEMNGYEVCRRLKRDAATRDIPVIFLSAVEDVWGKVEAFRVGGVDYVVKPFQPEEVLARVGMHLELSRNRAALADSLRRLQELEQARDAFTQMVAHDMRTPLWSVEVAMTAIGENLPARSAALRRLLEGAQTDIRGVQEMIAQMLDLSRLRHERMPLALTTVDLTALGQAVVAATKSLSGRRRVRLAGEPQVSVMADPGVLRRVITNLVQNAAKFTAEDGTIEITVQAAADGARVEVKDNGTGLSEEDQARIFEHNVQLPTREAARGFGIGLAFVQAAVKAHGGAVGVESRLGAGSTFWFCLPRIPAAEAPPVGGPS